MRKSQWSKMADDETDALSMTSSDFMLLSKMPTSRLQDIWNNLDTKEVAVVNLDAIIPAGEAGYAVLQTLLHKIKPSVKVLSVRFNNLHASTKDLLVEWIRNNGSLETLYIMGSGFDDAARGKLLDAWKKNLMSHRTDNMGNTFIRVYIDPNAPPPEDD